MYKSGVLFDAKLHLLIFKQNCFGIEETNGSTNVEVLALKTAVAIEVKSSRFKYSMKTSNFVMSNVISLKFIVSLSKDKLFCCWLIEIAKSKFELTLAVFWRRLLYVSWVSSKISTCNNNFILIFAPIWFDSPTKSKMKIIWDDIFYLHHDERNVEVYSMFWTVHNGSNNKFISWGPNLQGWVARWVQLFEWYIWYAYVGKLAYRKIKTWYVQHGEKYWPWKR